MLLYLFSFVIALISGISFWKLGGIGIWLDDRNKPVFRRVPSGGGIVAVMVISLFYLYLNTPITISLSFSLLIGLLIGMYDDFRGIRKWKKVPILVIPSIPILILYLLLGNLWNPEILWWNFGILYWIFIIPVVVAGFSNGGNVLGGYDGMETGVYFLISSLYFVIGSLKGDMLIMEISGIAASVLLAILILNWSPSKIILGNSGSFPIGALLGIIPLIGHFEIVLPIVFAPHLLEVFLQIKYTRKYSYTVFGDVDENGIIHNKYGKIMSIIHWIISWGNMTEKKITLAMLGIESVLCALAFALWIIFPL